MNGLICYRITGGELTYIVASYNGDFTIGQENDRKHTKDITIAGYTGVHDVLNVAIQITTNGKSVLHKSTRIICKEGVIIAYDLELAELGDDTDIMVELSKSLTTYLTKEPILAVNTAVTENIELPDNTVVKSFGVALEKYIGKRQIEADNSSDKAVLNSFGAALTQYIDKRPIAGTDSITVIEMGNINKDTILTRMSDAMRFYLNKEFHFKWCVFG